MDICMYCTAAIWQVFKTFTWFLLLLLSPDKAKLGRICSCCSYHSYFCVSFSWICSWAMVCKEWVRANRKDGDKLLSRMFSDWTRGYGFELKNFWFRLDTRKRFFAMWVMKHWKRLLREMLDVPSLETFESGWTELLGSWGGWRCPVSL